MAEFTHIDEEGQVRMVDVTQKKATLRTAVAQALVHMNPDTFEKIQSQRIQKGNVIETARIAGIMAAKNTGALIPMCHPLNLTHAQIDFLFQSAAHAVRITSRVQTVGPTGVEMEALTAVSVAALTIYDMCKSYDKSMEITDIFLCQKSGGKSGDFIRKKDV